MKYKSGSGQSGKRWKVRAQFKWCADQNYGFEVWSKGLPACNQRCDNRWAHRKCLIMSIIIMNGCATTTSMCQRTRCRRKKMNRSSAEREKENGKKYRDQSTIHSDQYETKGRISYLPFWLCAGFSSILFIISLSVSVGAVPALALRFFHFIFSLIWNGKTISVQLPFGLVWLLLLSSFFLLHKMWVNKNLLISFIMRMLLSRRWPLIAGCSFFSSHSLTHSAHVHMPLSSELEIFVQVLFISRLHVPAIVAVVLVGIVAGRVCECVCRLFSLCSFNTLVC